MEEARRQMGLLTEKKVVLGEYTLAYAEAGSGDAMVLLHGSDHRESWRVWETFVPLSDTHRLIVPDLVGYGNSSRPPETPDHRRQAQIIREMLERLSERNCSLVGSSWGGQIAIELALQWPSLARCLVLISSTYDKEQLPRLGRMNRPTLIIWAEDDLVTQLKAGYILRDAIKTSRLEILPPSAKDPRFDFTIAHRLSRFRSKEIIGLIQRFVKEPEKMIKEPPEMEDELRGMALRKKDDDGEGEVPPS